MFDKDLFLQLAKEKDIEVSEDGGKDIINGVEVDAMEIIFEPFNKSIEDMVEVYNKWKKLIRSKKLLQT